MCAYARYKGDKATYRGFVRWYGLTGMHTPDGYSYTSKTLDYKELNEMIRECVKSNR